MISSKSFYDFIARDYNGQMTKSDDEVRKRVMNIFSSMVPGGLALDFGGGTGLDLPWLVNKYVVYFLEPSTAMRSIAKDSLAQTGNNPKIVEENTDFHEWSAGHLPFTQKMNGILANFAVLNCIQDIACLFEKLQLLCAQNAMVVATVLDTSFLRAVDLYSLKAAVKILLHIPVRTENNYREMQQDVFLHTRFQYRTAAKKYFNVISYSAIKSSHFAVLILSKK
ncbi:MAG TPA: methyltransferase domain-containing protein [Puia sp.]|nr:methyltransferase domain-containing protein [Puia sp.]